MTTTVSSDPIYSATYRHGIDEKRRLQIPAKWRPRDGGEAEFMVIVWRNGKHGSCIRVVPPKQIAAMMNEIEKMSAADSKSVALRRWLGSHSDHVSMDKSGRICLPDEMAKEAALEKEALLVGLLDRFEIWHPERYDSVKQEDEDLQPDAIKLL